MTEIDSSRRIGSGPRRLGFKLGCVNFVEAFANTQTIGVTVLAITLIYNNDWLRNSGDQMNTAGCQLAGNCQPANTLFLAPENSQLGAVQGDFGDEMPKML